MDYIMLNIKHGDNITFQISTSVVSGKGNIHISDISSDKYIGKWQIRYRIKTDENENEWNVTEEFTGTETDVTIPATSLLDTYEVQVFHAGEIESEIQEVTVLEIGDYVAYEEQGGDISSYTSKAQNTGASTDQTFTLSDYNKGWRVLGIDENTEEILLISEDVIGPGGSDEYYTIKLQEGVKNGIEELNNICEIYGRGYGASGGRSLTVEDINKITGYDPETAKYGDGQINEYGNKVTYYWQETLYPYYESIDTEGNKLTGDLEQPHNGSFFWYDEENNTWNSSASSTTATSENKNKIVTLTNTYYQYSDGNGLNSNSEEYNILFSNLTNSSYWLASRFINTYSDYVRFGLREVIYDTVTGFNCWFSNGGNNNTYNAVRPVVSLRADINITSGGGTVDNAYKIQ